VFLPLNEQQMLNGLMKLITERTKHH